MNADTPTGPQGTQLHLGRHGPQLVTTRGHRWSDEAETLFLDHLAATANVRASAKACGFSTHALYARRRKDPAFMQRWDVALAQGYAHIEALLVQRAIEALDEVSDSILRKLEAIAPTRAPEPEAPDD